jgi:hypothetical protein
MQHTGNIAAGCQLVSYFRAADINQRRLDDVSPKFVDAATTPESLKFGEIRRFAARSVHCGQVAGIEQFDNPVPIDQIVDAIGADKPIDRSFAATLGFKLLHGFESITRRRFA